MSFVRKSAVQSFTSVSTATFTSLAPTAGGLLVLMVAWDESGSNNVGPALDATAIAAGWQVAENALGTASAHATPGAWFTGVGIFYLPNTTTGAKSVTLTDSSQFRMKGFIGEWSGYPASALLDQHGTNSVLNGTVASETTAATTTANQLWIAGCAANFVLNNANIGLTDPPTGFTTLNADQTTVTYAAFEFSYQEVVSTGTPVASYSWTGTGEGVVAIATFSATSLDVLMGQAAL